MSVAGAGEVALTVAVVSVGLYPAGCRGFMCPLNRVIELAGSDGRLIKFSAVPGFAGGERNDGVREMIEAACAGAGFAGG